MSATTCAGSDWTSSIKPDNIDDIVVSVGGDATDDYDVEQNTDGTWKVTLFGTATDGKAGEEATVKEGGAVLSKTSIVTC